MKISNHTRHYDLGKITILKSLPILSDLVGLIKNLLFKGKILSNFSQQNKYLSNKIVDYIVILSKSLGKYLNDKNQERIQNLTSYEYSTYFQGQIVTFRYKNLPSSIFILKVGKAGGRILNIEGQPAIRENYKRCTLWFIKDVPYGSSIMQQPETCQRSLNYFL